MPSVVQVGSAVSVVETSAGPKNVQAANVAGAPAGTVQITDGTFSAIYSGVSDFSFYLGPQVGPGSRLANLTPVSSQMVSFGDHDTYYSVAKGSQVFAYGNDVQVQATAGAGQLATFGRNALVLGGVGDNDSLWGAGSTIYSIVGPSNLTLGAHGTGPSRDHVFENFASTVAGLLPTDNFASVFGPGQAPGQFSLTYDPVYGAVNAVADGAGDTFAAFPGYATLTSPTAGTITVQLPAPPRTVFFFGGNGTDRAYDFVATSDAAMYGQGAPGNVEYLAAGGVDNVGILKTGAAASTSFNGAGKLEYSTGATAAGATDTLVYGNANARHVAFGTQPDTLANFRVGTRAFVGPTQLPTGPVVSLASDAVFALLGLAV